MSLFGREQRNFYGDPTFNPFERPSMPLQSLALDGVLGSGVNNDSGEQVQPLSAFTVPTAYRCISIISTVVGGCILEEIDKNGESTTWTAYQNLQSFTAFEMSELIVTHLAGWGNFYAFKVTGRTSNDLIDLQPIFPGNVHVLRLKGVKTYRVRVKTDEHGNSPAPFMAAGGKPGTGKDGKPYVDYTDDQVFHVPFLGYDGLMGMSPVMASAQTFGTTLAADRLAARFHSRGQQLGGIIQVKAPLSDQSQADAIKYNWRTNHGGVRNSGDVAVLDAETDFKPITINPNDLQLIEGRTWQAQEIARLYGVPLTMLSTNSTGYGDAIETQQVGFVTYTVRSYTDRIEQRFSREFQPRGRVVAFNLDHAMRGSTTERYQSYNTAIAGGWFLRSEARKAENMQEIPKTPEYDLSEPLVPTAANGQVAGPALAQPGAAPSPGAAPDGSQDDDEDMSID